MKREPDMLYVNGEHFVREKDGRFVTCDREDCGPEIEHIGDEYATLEEAIVMVDFWAGGGHWSHRPDV